MRLGIATGRPAGRVGHDATSGDDATKPGGNAPGVRIDRVEELRRAIAAGTYQVDARKIAEAIVRRHLTP